MRKDPGITLVLALVAAITPSDADGSAPGAAVPAIRSEMIVEWNRTLFTVAEEEDRFLTLKGVRAAAMMHLALHDALQAADPRFGPYAEVEADAAGGADPASAASEAAYAVARHEYPDRRADLDAVRDRWRATVPTDAARARGEALGRQVAAAILARREGDGWNRDAEYVWHPMAPGVYAEFAEHSGTPEGFVFGAGWAEARPFFLDAPDQFRVPPPPAIDSDAYTAAFREVKDVGRYGSASRTPDQSHLAMWWKEFVESSHNRLARDLVEREALDPYRAARLFALLNAAIFDAYVCVFDNKFTYNHWRPYTAIRWAGHDGNPDTAPEPDWTNTHRHTYAFPSYPSAHGCASAAAMTVLADTFGAKTSFTMRIPRVDRAGPLSDKVEMDPPTRSFGSFEAAAWECSLSRVYLGIHFRYDSEQGVALGRRIGNHAAGFLMPRAGP